MIGRVDLVPPHHPARRRLRQGFPGGAEAVLAQALRDTVGDAFERIEAARGGKQGDGVAEANQPERGGRACGAAAEDGDGNCGVGKRGGGGT
ncbi:hypothetical protein FACS189488_05260 [Betaproteobacteria bacterium]|nr:hypothetical protein FACS189488_05260 [Betaproteobacteria bacterium]